MRVGLGGGEAEVVAGGADDIPFNFFRPVLHLPWMRACSRGHGRRGGAEGGGGQGHAHRRAAAGGRLQPAGSTPKKATAPPRRFPRSRRLPRLPGRRRPPQCPREQAGAAASGRRRGWSRGGGRRLRGCAHRRAAAGGRPQPAARLGMAMATRNPSTRRVLPDKKTSME